MFAMEDGHAGTARLDTKNSAFKVSKPGSKSGLTLIMIPSKRRNLH